MNKVMISFIRKDINIGWLLIVIMLSLISGGSIIFSMEKLGGNFRVDNIYAMYAYLSKLYMIFIPIFIWGKEFNNRTINLIRTSRRNLSFIYLSKYLAYLIGSQLLMIFSFAEVSLYALVNHINIGNMRLFFKMEVAYFVFGWFYFGFVSLVTQKMRDTSKSILSVLIFYFITGLLCQIISRLCVVGKIIIELIPFSFIENSFSYVRYTNFQVLDVMIIGFILHILSIILFKKKGVV